MPILIPRNIIHEKCSLYWQSVFAPAAETRDLKCIVKELQLNFFGLEKAKIYQFPGAGMATIQEMIHGNAFPEHIF